MLYARAEEGVKVALLPLQVTEPLIVALEALTSIITDDVFIASENVTLINELVETPLPVGDQAVIMLGVTVTLLLWGPSPTELTAETVYE